jgi:broad specificity phosphatase PhoE
VILKKHMTQRRRVTFVRHASRLDVAHPEWVLGALRAYDTPLSEEGHGQARAAAEFFATRRRPAHLFSSPFLRAVETAAPIARALGMAVKIEPGLGENYYPQYFPVEPVFSPAHVNAVELMGEGLVEMDYQAVLVPEHPETTASSAARARRTMAGLLERFEGDLLLVTHGGIVHGLAKALDPAAVLLPHFAAVMELECDGSGRWRVTREGGDLSHLVRITAPEKVESRK